MSAEAAGSSGWCLLGQGSRELWPVLGSLFYQWVSGGILTEIDKIGKTKSRKTISSAELLVLSAGAQCRIAFQFYTKTENNIVFKAAGIGNSRG